MTLPVDSPARLGDDVLLRTGMIARIRAAHPTDGDALLALHRELTPRSQSAGNKADVSGNDLLMYYADDDRTQVIALYLESFGNPRKFARIARQVSGIKPIVALVGGASKAGRSAASGHTSAAVTSSAAVDALFQQCGVIRAHSLEQFLYVTGLLSHQALPKGRRVAIVSNGGGPAVLAADACADAGLRPQMTRSSAPT